MYTINRIVLTLIVTIAGIHTSFGADQTGFTLEGTVLLPGKRRLVLFDVLTSTHSQIDPQLFVLRTCRRPPRSPRPRHAAPTHRLSLFQTIFC
jgi:hypothetical protein